MEPESDSVYRYKTWHMLKKLSRSLKAYYRQIFKVTGSIAQGQTEYSESDLTPKNTQTISQHQHTEDFSNCYEYQATTTLNHTQDD